MFKIKKSFIYLKNILSKIKEYFGNIVFDKKRHYELVMLNAVSFLLLIVIINLVLNPLYLKNTNLNMYELDLKTYPKDSFEGKTFITATYPIFNDVVFVGDSYSHYLAYDLGFDVTNYSCPGLKLSELEDTFNAAYSVNKKYAVVFIGPNDFAVQTEPNEYSKLLKKYISDIKEKMNAYVIVCSYLPSIFTNEKEEEEKVKYTVKMYDDKIKQLEDIDNNIYYFDLTTFYNLEEHKRWTEENGDKIHFNYKFYITYINKLYELLMNIKKNEMCK